MNSSHAALSGKTVLIKFGGSTMENQATKESVAADVAELVRNGAHPILVHGGGKELTRWMEKLNLEVKFIDGLRHTGTEAIAVTEMVFAGRISGDIVSLVGKAGARAVGLSGRDADLFTAKRISSPSGADLGFVGEIERCDISIVRTLSVAGYVPIICSLAAGADGSVLNINADHAASVLAGALGVEELICLTDVDGIKIAGTVIQSMTRDEAKELLKHPEVTGGMIPKIDYAIDAIDRGVSRVRIINGHTPQAILTALGSEDRSGTTILKN